MNGIYNQNAKRMQVLDNKHLISMKNGAKWSFKNEQNCLLMNLVPQHERPT